MDWTSPRPWLCAVGLGLYGAFFLLVFLERDGIPTYEAAYLGFVAGGVVASYLALTPGRAWGAVLSVVMMVPNLLPFLFSFWVLLPQSLILAACLLREEADARPAATGQP